MLCEKIKIKKKKYCRGDFNKLIYIKNITTESGKDKRIRINNTDIIETFAIIQDYNSGGLDFIDDVVSNNENDITHLIKIPYYLEYEDFIKQSSHYQIEYSIPIVRNNIQNTKIYIFSIKKVVNEDFNNEVINIYVSMKRSNYEN